MPLSDPLAKVTHSAILFRPQRLSASWPTCGVKQTTTRSGYGSRRPSRTVKGTRPKWPPTRALQRLRSLPKGQCSIIQAVGAVGQSKQRLKAETVTASGRVLHDAGRKP